MAFPMTHLQVGYNLIDKLSWINNAADYMTGIIAPDCVHFREDYSGVIKGTSHLWHFGPRWGITTDNDGWLAEIKGHYKGHIETVTNKDFYTGYIVHILTDYLNDVLVWQPYRHSFDHLSEEEFKPIYDKFRTELAIMDRWLYVNSSDSKEIMNLLAEGKIDHFENLMREEDLIKAREWLLTGQYKEIEDHGEKYCESYTPEVLMKFIDDSVRTIPGYL